MARLNVKTPNPHKTHEGAPALPPRTAMVELRRAVSSCLLWEDQHYEDGGSIAKRIQELSRQVDPSELAELAVEARTRMNLRHAPLWLLLGLFGRKEPTPRAAISIAAVIQRPDEMGELIAMYRKDDRSKPLPASMKRGLAIAFGKFDEYQLAKYNRKADYRLLDVMRMVHPKPRDEKQAALWKRLRDGELATPDTWEVGLSAGENKKETFERLLREGKLGYMALLRNLSNMVSAKVDTSLVRNAILARKGARRLLPFRFFAAAKAAPSYEPEIDMAFLAEAAQKPKLRGRTLVVIDVSGSMYHTRVSAKSDMDRATAACALGAIARELCEDPIIYATAGSDMLRKHQTELVPPRRGMALMDAIYRMCTPLGGGGIFTKQVCDFLRGKEGEVERMIVITDEVDCGVGYGDSPLSAEPLGKHNYMINVASYANTVAHGKWVSISGFSEAVFDYILANESQGQGN